MPTQSRGHGTRRRLYQHLNDEAETKRIEARLEADFKDDLAWIEFQSERVPFDLLMNYERRPPIIRGPRSPRP